MYAQESNSTAEKVDPADVSRIMTNRMIAGFANDKAHEDKAERVAAWFRRLTNEERLVHEQIIFKLITEKGGLVTLAQKEQLVDKLDTPESPNVVKDSIKKLSDLDRLALSAFYNWVTSEKNSKDVAKNANQTEPNKSTTETPRRSNPTADNSEIKRVEVTPIYTWDVDVVIGRKYNWTDDSYEEYTTKTIEIKAASRSEAESKAASDSYTTKSNLTREQITVSPAGTKGAKFRVIRCEARRQ